MKKVNQIVGIQKTSSHSTVAREREIKMFNWFCGSLLNSASKLVLVVDI